MKSLPISPSKVRLWISQSYVWLTALLIFFIPSNLFLKFFFQTSYVNGLSVDYLLPKLYASDLIILLLLGIWLIEILVRGNFRFFQRFKKNSTLRFFLLSFISLVGILFLRQFWSAKPLAGIWFFCKLIEVSMLFFFFLSHQNILKQKIIWLSLCVTLIFQAVLGIYQYQTQQSFFPSYTYLGEINYNHPLFLAKGTFDGVEKILPYGTTSHPNVYAGFLTLGLFLTLRYWRKGIVLKIIFSGLILLSLFLAQSVAAFITLGILTIMWCYWEYFVQKLNLRWKLPISLRTLLMSSVVVAIFITPFLIHQLALDYPLNPSFVRRDQLNQAASNMVTDHPFIGVGLNNFTAEVEKYFYSTEIVRFVQPAHNIFLLWFAETGLLGIATAIVGIFLILKIRKPSDSKKVSIVLKTVLLIPLLLFDHYLLTQQTGLLILTLFLAAR